MKTFNEIKTIASSYVKDKVNDMALISEPLLRVENNKLCLGYFFVEFNDEQKKDYRVKRPTKWLTQDMISGIIIDVFDCREKDFSSSEILPYNKLYSNDGASILYDEVNYISKSFQKWYRNITHELSNETSFKLNLLYDKKVLKLSDEIVSPRDYVLTNMKSVFNEMNEVLFSKLGNTITRYFDDYQESLFNQIRSSSVVDFELIKQYYNCIKYLYPELIDIINAFNNIDGTLDRNYDENLRQIIEQKNKEAEEELLDKIDNEMKKIDKNYAPIKRVKASFSDEKRDVSDLIALIDKKLQEIDEDNN